MIIGIGTDIVHTSRIQAAIDRNPTALARRILTDNELLRFQTAPNPAGFLAKRFAAKEAASKAFGTGIGKLSWHDLEVINDSSGAPGIQCHGAAREMMNAMGADAIHLSLADESDTALAFVILSKR
jgi:holo-[acyl-carrier protein] synthase